MVENILNGSTGWSAILLVSSTRFKNGDDSSKKNIEIQPQTGAFDIGNVEAQAIVKLELSPPHNLPQTGQSRHYVQVGSVCTVAVGLAALTTGVAVTTDGVFVGGRKGVGGLNCPGWITQPLQDAVKSIRRITGMVVFISSPPSHCIPLSLDNNTPFVQATLQLTALAPLVELLRVFIIFIA